MNLKKKKLVFRIILAVGGVLGFLLVLLLVAVIVLNLRWESIEENCYGGYGAPLIWNTYEYPDENTAIKALESVPEEIIAAAHDYIIASGYNDPEITYLFINSLHRIEYSHLYDNHGNVEWAYYVAECYNNALTPGGFWLNREGKLVEDKGYIRKEEMEGVDTESVIGYAEAKKLAREVTSQSVSYYAPSYYRDEQGEIGYCYVVAIYHDYAYYVDAHSGEIVDRQPW